MRRAMTGLLAAFVVSSPVWGEEQSRDITDVRTILDGEGVARVLFKVNAPVNLDGVAIRRATLRLSASGSIESRKIRLRVHPVTTAWNSGAVSWTSPWTRPGGDFDDELHGRAQLDLGVGTADLRFDVTPIVKEIVEHGMEADGFILTVDPADGRGIRTADLARLQNLVGATLEVTYRRVSSPPSRRGA